MDKHESLRAAIYARVSGEQQTRDHTIESQVEALRERIRQDELAWDEDLCFVDEGYSGGALIRPALERLRDVAAAGGFNRLYVHSPDRLARKYAYQVVLVDELRRCGVELVFLNRAIGTSPEEDLLLQVQGMVAEYERAKILERSRRGKRHAARCGRVNVLGGAPYGYRYISKHDGDGEASYQVVLEEARVVRCIFTWIGETRLSIREVCRRLAKQGIPSPRGKGYWDSSTVWGMLKNPAYKGAAAFGKTSVGPRRPRWRPYRGQAEQPRRAYSVYDVPSEDWTSIPVPAIVSKDLFEAVAAQLEENRKRRRQSQRGARYLLQGLVACRCCGHAFYGKPVSRNAAKGKRRHYAYYRCIGMDAYRFGGTRICDNKQVRTDLLEAAVWEDVRSLLKEPDRLASEYQRRLAKDKDAKASENPSDLGRVITQVQKGITRLIDAYEAGLIERGEFEPRIQTARSRLDRLREESESQKAQQTRTEQLRLAIGQWEEFARQIQDGLHEADWSTRREIIRTLVKRVEVDKENVRVVYRVSPSPGDEGPDRGVLHNCGRCDFAAAE